jgi:hypothetical protein
LDRTIPTGKTWRDGIGEASNKAKCVFVLYSNHSVESDWVITEADFGYNKKFLIPISFEKWNHQLDLKRYRAPIW